MSGRRAPSFADHVHLFLEVAVRGHAGQLHQAAQRDLAPLAAHLRLAERLHEVARLALQGGVRIAHVGEVLAQAAEVALPLDLDLAQRLRRAGQRFLDRLDERLDGLLAFLERGLGVLLVPAEVFARETQEVVDVLAQLPAGDVVETPVELFHGAVDRQRALCFDRSRAAPSHPPAGARARRPWRQDHDEQRRGRTSSASSSQSIRSSGRAKMASARQAAGSSPSPR